MRTTALVAVNVFRESVRDKILYNLVAFAVLLIAASLLIGQLTAGQDIKIIKDLGLASISLFGVMIAVFIGIGLVWKEVEKRSIYSILSKPVTRHEFILGKYCGLLLTLVVNVAVMTTAFFAVLASMRWLGVDETAALARVPAADPVLLQAVLLITVELALVTAIALFFSTFSSPFLSAILTLGLWVIGSMSADFRNFETFLESPVAGVVGRVLYYVLPNFAAFDIKAQAVAGMPISTSTLGLTCLYGMTYVALVLVAATTVFSRRDFK
jgi:ABC-type transport system involved in multi-copper enzyme maturation permease subunit